MKKIAFIVILLISALGFAQKNWTSGKVVLKDGTTLKGLIKTSKSKLSFKKNSNAKVYKFGETKVNKVFFGTNNPGIGYYEFTKLFPNRVRLLKVIAKGKTKLYHRTVKRATNDGYTMPMSSNNGFSTPINHRRIWVKEYYVIRDGEKYATKLIGNNQLIPFKDKAKKYFYDCKDVVKYIENDLYEEHDIIELINDYNDICF